jgi:hypothetical protein
VERLLKQQPKDSYKLYSLHMPEVERIGKGKARHHCTVQAGYSTAQRCPAIGHMNNDGACAETG